MANDFNEFLDNLARGFAEGVETIKRTAGPFSGLLNPRSSEATERRVADLEARVTRQDRLIDSQLDTISKLRGIETERDALRTQLDTLTGGKKSKLTKDD